MSTLERLKLKLQVWNLPLHFQCCA